MSSFLKKRAPKLTCFDESEFESKSKNGNSNVDDEEEGYSFNPKTAFKEKKSKNSKVFKKIRQAGDYDAIVSNSNIETDNQDSSINEVGQASFSGNYSKDALRELLDKQNFRKLKESDENIEGDDSGNKMDIEENNPIEVIELSGAAAESIDDMLADMEEISGGDQAKIQRENDLLLEARKQVVLESKRRKEDESTIGTNEERIYTANLASMLKTDEKTTKSIEIMKSLRENMKNNNYDYNHAPDVTREESDESWENIVLNRALNKSKGDFVGEREPSKGKQLQSRDSSISTNQLIQTIESHLSQLDESIAVSEGKVDMLKASASRLESEEKNCREKLENDVKNLNFLKDFRLFCADLVSLVREKAPMISQLRSASLKVHRDFLEVLRSQETEQQENMLQKLIELDWLLDVDSLCSIRGKLKCPMDSSLTPSSFSASIPNDGFQLITLFSRYLQQYEHSSSIPSESNLYSTLTDILQDTSTLEQLDAAEDCNLETCQRLLHGLQHVLFPFGTEVKKSPLDVQMSLVDALHAECTVSWSNSATILETHVSQPVAEALTKTAHRLSTVEKAALLIFDDVDTDLLAQSNGLFSRLVTFRRDFTEEYRGAFVSESLPSLIGPLIMATMMVAMSSAMAPGFELQPGLGIRRAVLECEGYKSLLEFAKNGLISRSSAVSISSSGNSTNITATTGTANVHIKNTTSTITTVVSSNAKDEDETEDSDSTLVDRVFSTCVSPVVRDWIDSSLRVASLAQALKCRELLVILLRHNSVEKGVAVAASAVYLKYAEAIRDIAIPIFPFDILQSSTSITSECESVLRLQISRIVRVLFTLSVFRGVISANACTRIAILATFVKCRAVLKQFCYESLSEDTQFMVMTLLSTALVFMPSQPADLKEIIADIYTSKSAHDCRAIAERILQIRKFLTTPQWNGRFQQMRGVVQELFMDGTSAIANTTNFTNQDQENAMNMLRFGLMTVLDQFV